MRHAIKLLQALIIEERSTGQLDAEHLAQIGSKPPAFDSPKTMPTRLIASLMNHSQRVPVLRDSEYGRFYSSPTILMNSSTSLGSNCVPEHLLSSLTACFLAMPLR